MNKLQYNIWNNLFYLNDQCYIDYWTDSMIGGTSIETKNKLILEYS